MERNTVFEQLAAAGVCGLKPYIPGKPNDELERQYGIQNSIKLASNENPLGPPSTALEAVREALGYPALNLYGVSYGTRVAQHFAPQVVRVQLVQAGE